MTPRELCRRAVGFGKPDRLPLSFPSCGQFDFAVLPYTAPVGWQPPRSGEDEWGAVWQQTEIPNMGQMVDHPLANWEGLATWVMPDPDVPSRFDLLEERIREFPDKYIMAIAETVLTLWERYYSLRGFEQALTDPYVHPRRMHELLERVLDFHVRIIRTLGRRFGGRIDAFLVSDDWGTQRSTLFPVPLWRSFFKERYRRLVRAIHEAGMHAVLHSDGRINDYLPDLVGIGFDAFNLHSPRVVGIEEVGREFAGRVAFIPCIDIQTTSVRGSTNDVRREAQSLLEWWGTPRGGIIPSEYGREAIGAPERNIHAAYEAFSRLGMAQCGRAHRGAS